MRGGALGALVGAVIVRPLILWLGAPPLMLITAASLVGASLPLTWLAHRHQLRRPARSGGPPPDGEPVTRGPIVRLILHDPYLLGIAAMALIKNWVNTGGEYLLDRRLVESAREQVGDTAVALDRFIGAFKSDYFTYFNAAVLLLQLFAVSRIIRRFGVRRSLFIAPVVALLGYGTIAAAPFLWVIFGAKIVENSADYSVQKTVEQALFLVTSREAKYKAKPLIDTFFVRIGDMCSAAVVWLGAHLGASLRQFALAEVVMTIAWIGVVTRIVRLHRARAR
jgi:AAA family ATP:ADP antiporter